MQGGLLVYWWLSCLYYNWLPSANNLVGKYFIQRIERENLTLRNRIKRLNRKTLGYSKSPEMHDKVIDTFIEREYYVWEWSTLWIHNQKIEYISKYYSSNSIHQIKDWTSKNPTNVFMIRYLCNVLITFTYWKDGMKLLTCNPDRIL